MNTELSEKVDITRVMMQRAHGLSARARVTSLEAANAVLEQWASSVAGSEAVPCDVQIVFQDGFQYRGSYLLTGSHKRLSLATHVRRQLAALAHQNNRPRAANEPDISLIGATRAESARIALDHYNI